jgi:hypothetical protein
MYVIGNSSFENLGHTHVLPFPLEILQKVIAKAKKAH